MRERPWLWIGTSLPPLQHQTTCLWPIRSTCDTSPRSCKIVHILSTENVEPALNNARTQNRKHSEFKQFVGVQWKRSRGADTAYHESTAKQRWWPRSFPSKLNYSANCIVPVLSVSCTIHTFSNKRILVRKFDRQRRSVVYGQICSSMEVTRMARLRCNFFRCTDRVSEAGNLILERSNLDA